VLDALVASSAKPFKILISRRQDADNRHQYDLELNVVINATDNAGNITAFEAEQLDLCEKCQRRKLQSIHGQVIVRILQEKACLHIIN
jgi:hypothetical protein